MTSIAPGILAVGDRVPPFVEITNPTQGSTQGGTIALSANATDNDQVAGVRFYINGSAVGSEDTSAPFSINYNTANLKAGTNSVHAVARDRMGNTAQSATVTFTVSDQQPPTISITSPQNGVEVWHTITISANASDDVGVSGVMFNIDGTNISGWLGAPYSMQFDTHTLSQGWHTLYATARDTSNLTTQTSIQFHVSNAAPASGNLFFHAFVLDGVIDRTYVENWDNRFNQNWWWSGTGSKFGQLGLPGNPDPTNYQMQISWDGQYESAVPGTNFLDFQINNGAIQRPFANGWNGVWYNVNGGESIWCYRWSDRPDAAITWYISCNYRFVPRGAS